MTRTVILVPRRAGKPDRDRLWAFTRQRWRDQFPEYEIFEGHHDTGLFNRSAAINRAAGLADWKRSDPWDVALIIDADVLISTEAVEAGIAKALESGSMVIPFDVRRDLSPVGTDRVLRGFTGDWLPLVHRTYTEMVSAVVVVTRSLWNDVGGFDEGFEGWGFEDNAFAAACQTFGGPIVKLPGELWHLYHRTAKRESVGTPSFEANRRRANRYLEVMGDRDATLALRSAMPPAFEHHPTGIPRILHRTTPARLDQTEEKWWHAFKRLNPGWELMTHRDPLDPKDWPETGPYWDQAANGAQLADMIRLEALWRWGGVYVDADVEPLRSLEPLLPLSAFAGWEDRNCVPNAVMGAVPGHPAIRACLDLMLTRIPGETWQAGPGVTTAVLPGRHDVVLFPPGSFYGVHYKDPDRARKMRGDTVAGEQPWAFVLHHYAGSWLKPEAQR